METLRPFRTFEDIRSFGRNRGTGLLAKGLRPGLLVAGLTSAVAAPLFVTPSGAAGGVSRFTNPGDVEGGSSRQHRNEHHTELAKVTSWNGRTLG